MSDRSLGEIMKNFFKRYEEEIEEVFEGDNDLDIINLDETAGWSKLDIAEELAKQQAVNLMEEIGDELAIIDAVEEDVVVEELKPREKEKRSTHAAAGAEVSVKAVKELEELSDDDIGIEHLQDNDIEIEHLQDDDIEYITEDDEEEEEVYIEDSTFAFFEDLAAWFSRWTILDKVVAVVGVFVLAAAIATVGVYAGNRSMNKQLEAFAPVGEQLESIGVVGQDKLLAVADAKKAMLEAAKLEEELNQEYEENEFSINVKVVMKMTSVQKDLKIKFVNKKSGKLIGNIPFEVKIVDPDNKTYNKIDEDMDGIIYLTNITPGDYSVSMEELKAVEGYSFSTTAEKIKVKENIEYQKIDVTEEIKDQSEVDVSKEDTAQKTETEAVLTDTVEWVESTQTEASTGETYIEVSIDTIADPALSASLNLDLGIVRVMQQSVLADNVIAPDFRSSVSGNNPNTDNETAAVTEVSLNKTSVNLLVGGSEKLTATVKPTNATNPAVTWKSSDSSVANVGNDGMVNALAAGSATITVTTKDGEKTATCTVTVTENETGTTAVTGVAVNPTELSLKVGNTGDIVATVTPENATDKTVTWASSDIAVATVDTAGKVTAVKEGTATITVTTKDGEKTAACTVTVSVSEGYDPKTDTTNLLKDKSGNQIYILVDGKYIEAKVADYYKTNTTFYKKEKVPQYIYTGWQNLDGKTYYFDKNGNKVTGEQIIQGAKYNFNSDGALNTGSGILGIDVSTWNGNIDWNKVKNSGVSYVIIRTGFRGSTQGSLVEDNKFRQNIQGATNAGLKVGVYFFSQAINEVEAVEEASMVLGQIKGYKLAYPVFIDVEPSGGRADSLSSGDRTKVINAFCQTIQNGGYRAGIYANKTWLGQKMNVSALSGYKIWLAQYNSTVTYGGRYDMWQYSDKGTVSGISGKVDMNLSYLSY